MKTIISFFVAALFSIPTLIAQNDAAVVANWGLPIDTWFPNGLVIPAEGVDAYPRSQAIADPVSTGFDAVECDFDALWAAGIAPYSIAKQNGNALSAKGTADFTGAFKVLFDDVNECFYVFLQYTDDDLTGTESIEMMWAQDLKIDALATLYPAIVQAPYARYAAFGGAKATFTGNAFTSAFLVTFNSAGMGSTPFSAPMPNASFFVDNKTALGSKTIKKIYTIPYDALKGTARPNFSTASWRTLNASKGISFDIKVNDIDANDVMNTKPAPVIQSAEYWWNSTHNDGYALTYFAGFLKPAPLAGLNPVNIHNSIFGKIISNKIELKKAANVVVFNSLGKLVLNLKNVNNIDLTNLNKGIYIIRANNESLKFQR